MHPLILFLVILNSLSPICRAQCESCSPEFPGGQEAMQRHIQSHLRYPEVAKAMGLDGTVYLALQIDSLGALALVTVTRGVNPLLDAEALRVMHTFPNFDMPQAGNSDSNSLFHLPITFQLESFKGQAVDDVLLAYQKALTEEKGAEACRWLHPTTLAWFDQLAAQIRTADTEAAKNLPPFEMATLLAVRQSMDRKRLKQLDGKMLFVFLVDRGILGKSSAGIGMPLSYALNDGLAQLEFQDGYYVYMKQVETDWRMQLTPGMDDLNITLRQLAAQNRQTLTDFIVQSVEARLHAPLHKNIWKAPFSH